MPTITVHAVDPPARRRWRDNLATQLGEEIDASSAASSDDDPAAGFVWRLLGVSGGVLATGAEIHDDPGGAWSDAWAIADRADALVPVRTERNALHGWYLSDAGRPEVISARRFGDLHARDRLIATVRRFLATDPEQLVGACAEVRRRSLDPIRPSGQLEDEGLVLPVRSREPIGPVTVLLAADARRPKR